MSAVTTKEEVEIIVDSERSSVSPIQCSRKSKWKFHLLNVEDNPDNDHLFDGEPYTIDNMLEFEDNLRTNKTNAPRWKKVVGIIWDPIFLPPSERKYMIKIDFFIYIYAIFACFVKYLDQTNVKNAYVSGMKEDLDMYGSNDYNWITTYFNIGYLSFSVLMATLIKYVRPSIILPTFEIIWTAVVMCLAASKNKQTLFGLRFLQGVVEASSFPGLVMITGEYYSSEGLGKKMFMLDATSQISSMFAGYIQAGVYTSMNGKCGLAGWRWVFLVDGFISIPVAALGFYCLPDFPENTKASWMSKKDRQFAMARAKRYKRVRPKPMTLKSFVKVFFNWKLWLFVFPYVTGCLGGLATNYFSIYLKGLGKYTVQQVNVIPTAQNAWTFIQMFLFGALSDYTGNRILYVTLCSLIGIFTSILLSVWSIPFGLLIFAYIFGSGTTSQTIIMSWGAETFYDEPDLKAINIAVGNSIIYAFNAFLPLGIFKTKDSPHFTVGYPVCVMFYFVSLVAGWTFWFFVKRYNKQRAARLERDKILESDAP